MSKTAFIYPGQGAQECFMGKDFYDNCDVSRQVYDMADDILDISVKDICFTENEIINETAYTQPALVTTCLAITAELNRQGIYPDVTAGLSLGEYAAIAAAGGMTYKAAIKTVRARGIYMQEAVPSGKGSMAAVLGMTGEQIENVIKDIEDVYIANYNCPGQLVITGMKDAVLKAGEALTANGAKRVVALNVSGPFHSPFLEEAGKKLEPHITDIQELEVPYVANVTGDYVRSATLIKEYLVKQVSSSVRWEQSVRTMIADGVDTFVEIGPGKTLAGFMKRIDRNVAVYNVSKVSDIEALKEAKL